MLDVLVIKLAVSENMVHVVLGAPPLKAVSTDDGGYDSSVLHKQWMSVVGH